MLCSLKEILKIAEAKKCAIGAFNTPNMSSLRAVLGAAEELNMPVIIMHAQLHEEMGICKMDEIGPVMLLLADKAKVPVCVHLDHGTDFDYLKRGLDIGFTSIMYDGSERPAEENYAYTSLAVEMASRYGVSVEAEIGSMGIRETGARETEVEIENPESIYTDPDEAQKFALETGIDALSCAFGSVHGFYLREPKLDFPRLAEINKKVHVPLVMHGGSGVSDEDFKKVIERGIRKVNCYTYMAKAGGTTVAALKDLVLFHDAELAAIAAMKEDVKNTMTVFMNK